MPLDRRTFVAGAGATAFLASSGCLFVSLPAYARSQGPTPRADPGGVANRAAPELEAQFRALLRWMAGAGWSAMLRDACGLALDPDRADLDGELFRPIATAAFGGFGGERAIQPGDPGASLLYHVLASPGLAPADGAPEAAYPSLEQIDLLENYIYARQPLPADLGEATLAMFAYQYRPAHKTPHCKHSDLVFSRTGVARTGNADARYDPVMRSYDNAAGAGGRDRVAVTPARYGLFWARPVRLPKRMTGESGDDDRLFLMPERKVYSGCPSIGGATLCFAESHRDEKLSRLIVATGGLPPRGFNPQLPPFLRHSRSTAGPAGCAPLPGHDSNLVALAAKGSSVLVLPATAELVAPARQNNRRVRFRVPPRRASLGLENRRYTSLKLEKRRGFLQLIDLGFSDIVFAHGQRVTGYRAPKNAPAFVNIRYRLAEDTDDIEHLGPDWRPPTGSELRSLEDQTNQGGYWAGLFIDGLCDGCVTARLEPDPRAGAADSAPPSVLPAFSLVAAPDFFPKVDPLDFDDYDEMFLEGGPEDASGGRQRANPHIPHPIGRGPAFPLDPPTAEADVATTITAVVSAEARTASAPTPFVRALGLNTLPDTSSRVFAPGWDMTFSRDRPGPTYFATFGLGSPFPEDMKLCAAANGMWPGVSPDAARTFHPSLKGVPSLGGVRKPQTAIPLLDEEIGYHPRSPARADHGVDDYPGWDGEYGPFLEVSGEAGQHRLSVNYADVGRADYVQNAIDGKLDFTRLRGLSSEELIGRMRALQACIRALPGGDSPRYTHCWLISAEKVSDWRAGARALGVPNGLFGDSAWARAMPDSEAPDGGGWLYLFARVRKAERGMDSARETVPCRTLYVCQVAGERVRWCAVAGTAPHRPVPEDWSWTA